MDMEDLTTGEKIALAGGALAVVAAFLPWVSAGPFTVSGIDGDGTFTLIFGAIAGGIVLLRDWEKADILGVGLLGVLSVLVAGNVYNNLGGTGGGTEVIGVSAGFGLHLTMLAAILLIVAAAQGYRSSDSTTNQQFAGNP